MIDVALTATEKLLRSLAGRIMRPMDVADMVESRKLPDVSLLPERDIDVGQKARIAITSMGDDSSTELITSIITSCTEWIEAFLTKMLKTLPFDQMKLYSFMHPPTLTNTSVSDCKYILGCDKRVVYIDSQSLGQCNTNPKLLIQ